MEETVLYDVCNDYSLENARIRIKISVRTEPEK